MAVTVSYDWAIGSVHQLNETHTVNNQGSVAIAALASGGYFVAFDDPPTGPGDNFGLVGRIMNADTSPLTAEFALNSTTDNDQKDAALATLLPGPGAFSGNAILVFTDTSVDPGGDIRFRLYSSSGTSINNNDVGLDTSSADDSDPSVAGLVGGGDIITWTRDLGGGNRDIYAEYSTSKLGTDSFRVSALDSMGTVNSEHSVVAGLANGGYAVAWGEHPANGGGVGQTFYYRRYDSPATPVDNQPVQLGVSAENTSLVKIVALAGGGFAATFESGGVAFAKVVHADGTPSSTAGVLHPKQGDFVGGNQHIANITTLANGGFAVLFTTTQANWAFVQAFDSDGNALGNSVQVDTDFSDGAIAQLTDGKIAYAAASHRSDGSGDSIVHGIENFVRTTIGTAVGESLTGDGLRDLMNGGDGADVLDGRGGGDFLTGGPGDDTFVFAPHYGAQHITDLVAGAGSVDHVDLTKFTNVHSLANVLARATSGADTVIDFGKGDVLTLENLVKSSLSADDFTFNSVGRSDFGANGHDDILWKNDNGAVSIWDDGQIGNAHFVATGIAASWHVAFKGEFDDSGRDDILWQNDNGAVSIWDNGRVEGAHIIANAGAVAASWHIAGTGDFDGNYQSDILWRNDNGAVSIWDNGAIGGAHIIADAGIVSNSWHISGTGDFNGNGRDDILWRNDSGAVSIWDDGRIAAAHIIADAGVVANSWHIAGTGDFDGNGRTDILWRNDNGAVSIWDNGQLSGAHIVANAGVVSNTWHISDTGDYDGNTRSDILWRNDNGAVSIWDNGNIANAHIIAAAGVVAGDWHIA